MNTKETTEGQDTKNGELLAGTDAGDDADDEELQETSPLCGSYRLLIAGLGFFCFLICMGQRASMSVAIVCMMNHTALERQGDVISNGNTSNYGDNGGYSNTSIKDGCGFSLGGDQEPLEDGPFTWSRTIQGQILSSFFIGYFISQFPIGFIAERLSPKWVFTFCFGMATLGNLFTPLAARVHYILLIVVRVLTGMGTSATFPCMHAILSRWTPPLERSRITNLAYSGVIGGGVVGMVVTGVLCKHGFGDKWGSSFYVLGAAAVVAWVLWIVLVSSTPAENKFMNKKEKLFIQRILKGQEVGSATNKGRTPICAILTSGPVWAIAIANFCSDWGLFTLVTNIPTFLNEVHYFDIQSNGLMSALPFTGFALNMFISPMIADKLMTSKTMTPTTIRKVFNTIGMGFPAISLLTLSFIPCTQPILAIVLLTLAGTMSGCYGSGFLINHIEIAPKYAGTLVGLTNGVAGTSGFIAPTVATALTKNGTRQEWQIVFFIASGMYVLGAVLYCVLASAEIQPWAKEQVQEENLELKVEINGNR